MKLRTEHADMGWQDAVIMVLVFSALCGPVALVVATVALVRKC